MIGASTVAQGENALLAGVPTWQPVGLSAAPAAALARQLHRLAKRRRKPLKGPETELKMAEGARQAAESLS